MSYRATSLYTDWVEAWSRSFPASTRRWPSETRRMPATPSRPVIPSHQPPEAASTPVSVHCLHPRNYTPVVFMDQDGRRLLFWHCSVHTRVITRYTYMHTKRFMIHTYIHTHIHNKKTQLSPRDRAMRRVSWNLVNCHATVQKLLVRQVPNKSKLWSWRVTMGRCVINMCTQPWRDRVAFIVL